jgi:hypothetical protein
MIRLLDPAATRRVGDRLLERLRPRGGGSAGHFGAAVALTALVARLDPAADRAQIERITAAAFESFFERAPEGHIHRYGLLLAATVPLLSPDEQNRLTDRLLRTLETTDNYARLQAAVSVMLAALNRSNADPVGTGRLAGRAVRAIARAAERPENTTLAVWVEEGGSVAARPLLRFVTDLADLAELLTSPACTGDLRGAVLERLEELAFPRPFPGPASVGLAVPMFGIGPATALAALERYDWLARRRFHRPWDAADWLARHRPDLDLNAPHKPRSR